MGNAEIKTVGFRSGSTTADYFRFFKDVEKELTLRAEVLEAALIDPSGAPLWPKTWKIVNRASTPNWEVQDVFHFTDASKDELLEVLPPLFRSLRRFEDAACAVDCSQNFKKKDRIEIQSSGDLAAIKNAYRDAEQRRDTTDRIILSWLKDWTDEGGSGERVDRCGSATCRGLVDWNLEEFIS